jgi:1,4-dihydroxy-2-naphthoyl-CoA hydrolase
MSIWTRTPDLLEVNRTLIVGHAAHLGMKAIAYDDNSLTTAMPVAEATRQPDGLLSGGASAALAEITAGIAGAHCIDAERQFVVGQELNISHVRSARSGEVTATARPVRLGGRSQVWQIDIRDESGALVATSRLTNAILERRRSPA